MRQELLAALHDGHRAAEAAEHLGELQADVAPAEDEQLPRNLLQLHDRGGVEEGHLSSPAAPARPAGARVDEDLAAARRRVPPSFKETSTSSAR